MDPRIVSAFALYAFLVVGVFLLVAPWTPVWFEAVTLVLPEGWAEVVRRGWVRGLVSAVGAIDLVIAVQLSAELIERLRRREDRGGPG